MYRVYSQSRECSNRRVETDRLVASVGLHVENNLIWTREVSLGFEDLHRNLWIGVLTVVTSQRVSGNRDITESGSSGLSGL